MFNHHFLETFTSFFASPFLFFLFYCPPPLQPLFFSTIYLAVSMITLTCEISQIYEKVLLDLEKVSKTLSLTGKL